MKLVVSIVNYRTPELVVDCVHSLNRHAPTRAEMEIVVVDNGSGDGSPDRIAAALPGIALIDAGANLGFAAGNNLVLRQCRGDAYLLLNSDARVEAGTLDCLLAAMEALPRAAAVGARIVDASGGADQDYPCRFPTLGAMVRRAVHGAEFPAAGHQQPVELERLHGAGMLMRATALDQVGLLDEGFFMYDEDVDWCARVRAQGWSVWLVPQARVGHVGGASSGRSPSGQRTRAELGAVALRMRYELRRSRYRLYRKHRNALELLLLKLATDAVLCAQCVAAAVVGLADPARRGAAFGLLRGNLHIIGINPFRLTAARHGPR